MPQSDTFEVHPRLATVTEWQRLSSPRSLSRDVLENLANTDCVALVGAQNAGKTTMLKNLSGFGFPTVSENLREISEDAFSKSVPPQLIKRAFPHIVALAAKNHVDAVVAHASSGNHRILFTDRGLGDYLAALRLINMAANLPFSGRRLLGQSVNEPDYLGEILEKKNIAPMRAFLKQQISVLKEWCSVIRYRKVLWLESLPVEHPDNVRSNSKLAKIAYPLMNKLSWMGLGYRLRSVDPHWEKPDTRVRRILELSKPST